MSTNNQGRVLRKRKEPLVLESDVELFLSEESEFEDLDEDETGFKDPHFDTSSILCDLFAKVKRTRVIVFVIF